ncbi:hypothetical protein [Streptomyces marincola]|uniref:hypothetical protein n=1 Tax=Streptomyces marincola TaxID=2878388 RepID=UPI001CF28570|nr:hypothetical protein [Streptomyces marincola]UCM88098.1 hypothetical protein LC193_09100 [Streptomyces marincola]
MTAPRTVPEWMPSGLAAILSSGQWRDAVRTPSLVETRVVGVLRDRSGPVVADRFARTMTWFVPTGATAGWDARLLGVQVLGRGLALLVAPADALDPRRSVVWWAIPPNALSMTGSGVPLDALRGAR